MPLISSLDHSIVPLILFAVELHISGESNQSTKERPWMWRGTEGIDGPTRRRAELSKSSP